MTAKEFLRQYEEANRRALRYKTEYEKELELIDSVRSTLGGDGQPHGSGISKTVENQAIRLADKAAAWKIAELDAIEARQTVFDMVHSVSGVEGDILYERYVNLRKWEDICVIIHMSWKHTHRLHARALQIVAEKMTLNDTQRRL